MPPSQRAATCDRPLSSMAADRSLHSPLRIVDGFDQTAIGAVVGVDEGDAIDAAGVDGRGLSRGRTLADAVGGGEGRSDAPESPADAPGGADDAVQAARSSSAAVIKGSDLAGRTISAPRSHTVERQPLGRRLSSLFVALECATTRRGRRESGRGHISTARTSSVDVRPSVALEEPDNGQPSGTSGDRRCRDRVLRRGRYPIRFAGTDTCRPAHGSSKPKRRGQSERGGT